MGGKKQAQRTKGNTKVGFDRFCHVHPL